MAKGAKVNLTEGKVSSHVLRMLGPFSIAVIALISTGIVDTIYLGRLTDAARPDLGVMALAALGFAFPLTFLGNSANIGIQFTPGNVIPQLFYLFENSVKLLQRIS